MIVTLIAPGSRGDLQPYLALGKGLATAGHTARLVTHENFAELVHAHGVDLYPIPGDVQAIAQSDAMAARIAGGNFAKVLAEMARQAEAGAMSMAEAGLRAAEGADLIIAGLGGLFTGVALAQRLSLPLLQAYYIPLTPTRAQPAFVVPELPAWAGPIPNRISYAVARQMLWQGFRRADRRARHAVLGLPPGPFWGPFGNDALRHGPVLYGYSPAVIPRPGDWRENILVTGYWFLEEGDTWSPSEQLVSFLESGPPPVFIGFGSMPSADPLATAELILEAVDRSGVRALLLAGWGGMHLADTPESVLTVQGVPYSWLFPRCAAVVHHGGAGTAAAGLRAGVPSVVVPFFGDQPFWGRRVAALGAGPEPIPRRRLTPDRLAATIRQATTDTAIRERAAAIGGRIREEQGVQTAVHAIEKMMQYGEIRRP